MSEFPSFEEWKAKKKHLVDDDSWGSDFGESQESGGSRRSQSSKNSRKQQKAPLHSSYTSRPASQVFEPKIDDGITTQPTKSTRPKPKLQTPARDFDHDIDPSLLAAQTIPRPSLGGWTKRLNAPQTMTSSHTKKERAGVQKTLTPAMSSRVGHAPREYLDVYQEGPDPTAFSSPSNRPPPINNTPKTANVKKPPLLQESGMVSATGLKRPGFAESPAWLGEKRSRNGAPSADATPRVVSSSRPEIEFQTPRPALMVLGHGPDDDIETADISPTKEPPLLPPPTTTANTEKTKQKHKFQPPPAKNIPVFPAQVPNEESTPKLPPIANEKRESAHGVTNRNAQFPSLENETHPPNEISIPVSTIGRIKPPNQNAPMPSLSSNQMVVAYGISVINPPEISMIPFDHANQEPPPLEFTPSRPVHDVEISQDSFMAEDSPYEGMFLSEEPEEFPIEPPEEEEEENLDYENDDFQFSGGFSFEKRSQLSGEREHEDEVYNFTQYPTGDLVMDMGGSESEDDIAPSQWGENDEELAPVPLQSDVAQMRRPASGQFDPRGLVATEQQETSTELYGEMLAMPLRSIGSLPRRIKRGGLRARLESVVAREKKDWSFWRHGADTRDATGQLHIFVVSTTTACKTCVVSCAVLDNVGKPTGQTARVVFPGLEKKGQPAKGQTLTIYPPWEMIPSACHDFLVVCTQRFSAAQFDTDYTDSIEPSDNPHRPIFPSTRLPLALEPNSSGEAQAHPSVSFIPIPQLHGHYNPVSVCGTVQRIYPSRERNTQTSAQNKKWMLVLQDESRQICLLEVSDETARDRPVPTFEGCVVAVEHVEVTMATPNQRCPFTSTLPSHLQLMRVCYLTATTKTAIDEVPQGNSHPPYAPRSFLDLPSLFSIKPEPHTPHRLDLSGLLVHVRSSTDHVTLYLTNGHEAGVTEDQPECITMTLGMTDWAAVGHDIKPGCVYNLYDMFLLRDSTIPYPALISDQWSSMEPTGTSIPTDDWPRPPAVSPFDFIDHGGTPQTWWASLSGKIDQVDITSTGNYCEKCIDSSLDPADNENTAHLSCPVCGYDSQTGPAATVKVSVRGMEGGEGNICVQLSPSTISSLLPQTANHEKSLERALQPLVGVCFKNVACVAVRQAGVQGEWVWVQYC